MKKKKQKTTMNNNNNTASLETGRPKVAVNPARLYNVYSTPGRTTSVSVFDEKKRRRRCVCGG